MASETVRASFKSLIPAALAVGLIAFTPSAAAADDVRTVEARARFEEGVVLHDKGDCEGAIAKFAQAYALRPHPDVLFNLGVSHRACGHPVEAERAFASYLRHAKVIPADRRRVAK